MLMSGQRDMVSYIPKFFFFGLPSQLLIDKTITGDIFRLNILGQDIVFINSAQAAFDLLDKRGAIYSGKPRLVMVGEL